jgi:formamidopyrimidine-DNA glycosylase
MNMLEIPESKTIGSQANERLSGRRIIEITNGSSPHKFAFYHGDPAGYVKLLKGKEVKSARAHGMFVDICCDNEICITISDGANMRYYPAFEKPPEKHQLLIGFDNGSCVAFTVAMYGGIYAYRGIFDNKYHRCSLNSVSPLEDNFDQLFFDNILKNTTRDLPLKALLATEQRIPGVGNGVLQDILFNAGLHPRRKKSTLSDLQKAKLFQSLKSTLKKMTDMGGRDTEKDFFGQNGNYKTLLSKNTLMNPCPGCGHKIVKEAYLGGAVYFCPACQKL